MKKVQDYTGKIWIVDFIYDEVLDTSLPKEYLYDDDNVIAVYVVKDEFGNKNLFYGHEIKEIN